MAHTPTTAELAGKLAHGVHPTMVAALDEMVTAYMAMLA